MITLKPVSGTDLNYTHIVGTGGIGSGLLFLMRGNHTLGRNESRMAKLLPGKDFCKLHIIMHYVSVLLGAQVEGKFQSFPIGKVGNDHSGKELIEKMKKAGMNTKYISISADSNTLFSVCYQYPDNTGGNITTEDSACSKISPKDISHFFSETELEGRKEIILAVPEVPLDARIKLLKRGRKRNSLNIASVLSSEADEFKSMGGFDMVDILSINIDEAKSIAQIAEEASESKTIIDACIRTLVHINPAISVLITDGPCGSYCYENNYIEFTPVPNVDVIATAGAGDAFLAGTIAGLSCGLKLTKGVSDNYFSETPVKSAAELGTLVASMSVTSQDTIHPAANTELLYKFAKQNAASFSQDFLKIFRDCIN